MLVFQYFTGGDATLIEYLDCGNDGNGLGPLALGIPVAIPCLNGLHAVDHFNLFALQRWFLRTYLKGRHFDELIVFFIAEREIAPVVTFIDIGDPSAGLF